MDRSSSWTTFSWKLCSKQRKREEFKDAHNKDSLRNRMGDSAVANSEPAPATPDTSKTKTDSTKVK
ncbi:hypothetical protein [Chryseobacterium capnotolerans]|uniref:hypothetical protein n=1 Tax=Chryseobacterium capnotolerans TaxID=2759528 RepID=UPI001E2F6D84|nr:hypothetical protein [Chryseobacterium capnotolerans]